jgi:hypothetical protein
MAAARETSLAAVAFGYSAMKRVGARIASGD